MEHHVRAVSISPSLGCTLASAPFLSSPFPLSSEIQESSPDQIHARLNEPFHKTPLTNNIITTVVIGTFFRNQCKVHTPHTTPYMTHHITHVYSTYSIFPPPSLLTFLLLIHPSAGDVTSVDALQSVFLTDSAPAVRRRVLAWETEFVRVVGGFAKTAAHTSLAYSAEVSHSFLLSSYTKIWENKKGGRVARQRRW